MGIENSDLATCCGSTFSLLKVSFYYFFEVYYHVDFRHQIDSNVLSIEKIPVLVFVMIDLQIELFVGVVIVKIWLQLDFILMKKFHRIIVAILQIDFVIVW